MPGVRDHDPVVIEQFGGWWNRGDPESAPSDHLITASNVQYFNSGVETRYGISPYQSGSSLKNIKRVYNYVMNTGQSLLVLANTGEIYHVIGPNTVYGPILKISTMEDFGFVAIAGRAYITPFKTYTNSQGVNHELGIQNEFVYVYKGDGTQARKIGGKPPTGAGLSATLGSAGLTDIFIHLFAVVYETDTGYITAPGPEVFAQLELTGVNKVLISNIPVSPDPFVKKRHIIASKGIPEYNGDQKGYQLFYVPEGTIENNTETSKEIEFFDIDLVDDASHLLDNFSEIPACVNLNTYHSRLVCVGEYGNTETLEGLPPGVSDNRSLARISYPGEPEAISKIDGLIVVPLDGNPLTNAQEFRDILYLFKKTRTYAYSDNDDEPVTWREEVLDQGIGAPVHGIATVLDSGGVNIDYLVISDMSGLMLFNGTYAYPEMSWKIENVWLGLDKNNLRHLQIVNDSLGKKIWFTLPEPFRHILLHADYRDGMDAKNIRWARWTFDVKMSCITLTETNRVILGGLENLVPGPPDLSGIFSFRSSEMPVESNSRDDYYNGVQKKIPDPTIRTAFLGE